MPKQKKVKAPKVNRQAGIHLHKTKPKAAGKKPRWYWIMISKNGRTISRSSQMHARKLGAVKSILWMHEHFDNNAHYFDHTEKGYEAAANLIAL